MSVMSMSGFLQLTSVAAVIEPLRDGLVSVNSVYEALIASDVHPATGQCSNYNPIRQQIVLAEESLKRSEQAASDGLRSLDTNTEILTRDLGRFEWELSDTKQTLQNLETQEKSNEKSKRDSERALGHARDTLSSTTDTLQSQEERKRNAEIVTGVGAGLLVIPVVGWIAGTAMVVSGAVELDQAGRNIKAAEEEVRYCESQVTRYRSKVSEYEQKISQTRNSISQKQGRVEEIRGKIYQVNQQRAAVGDFQQKVRKAVNILGMMSGRASVVEIQTHRFILQEAVMKVMEDLTEAAGQITGNQLLLNEGIPNLIEQMKQNHRRLEAICASSHNDEHQDYY